jgi:ribosome-binding factor A
MKNMGDGRRVARVEREVQATIAQYLIRGFSSSLPGLVTVSQVKMPGDLRVAKVYVSVLGSDVDREEVIEILQERAFEIQNYIGKELKMRYCPKLTFYADFATEQILKVDKIIQELGIDSDKKSKEEDESESDDE